MSMAGELENLNHEITLKTAELAALKNRRDELKKLMSKQPEPLLDMHLDPDKRNWEYDGYGYRIPKNNGENYD